MKAIETSYEGYRFRSRQEARWAVFFDEMGVPWEYEVEGFELDSGRYLPDFWLPSQDCFFEVKGNLPTKNELNKVIDLSLSTRKLVALASGQTKTKELKVGSYRIEWPVDGFQIQLFAGRAYSTWECSAYDFGLWNWMLDTDLPSFIAAQFPQELFEAENLENRRRMLINLDRQYYRRKYGKEHPRYIFGRHVDRANWVSDKYKKLRFSLEPEQEPSLVSKAYIKAIGARFEFGESGAK